MEIAKNFAFRLLSEVPIRLLHHFCFLAANPGFAAVVILTLGLATAADPVWRGWPAYSRVMAGLMIVCVIIYAVWSTEASGLLRPGGAPVGARKAVPRRPAGRRMMSDAQPRLYADLATWWPLFSPPSHYEEEAADLLPTLLAAPDAAPSTMLELGCGGGSRPSPAVAVAHHLERALRLTLTDRSEQMLLDELQRLAPRAD